MRRSKKAVGLRSSPGRTIQLAVVRVRTSRSPAPNPLFVGRGGPGDATIGVFVNLALPGRALGLRA